MHGSPGECAAAIRRSAGLFELDDRGLIAVRGGERLRWLNGMISNDVAALRPQPDRSGCYATLLTPQGRIVADLHVLLRQDEYWLETRGQALPGVLARLEHYIIADDVSLEDLTGDWARLSLEGPAAPRILARVAGRDVALAPECGDEIELAGVAVVVMAYGWSGLPAYQLFVPPASRETLRAALIASVGEAELLTGTAEVLEVLRIEAGIPRLLAELDEEVLPAEARLLERAVSTTKGCYTGQEIVARMDSRGQVGHRLVGFRFEGVLPAVAADVVVADRRVGEVTSVCHSALAGPIGLGYVRTAHEAPDTAVTIDGVPARVAALPFVADPM